MPEASGTRLSGHRQPSRSDASTRRLAHSRCTSWPHALNLTPSSTSHKQMAQVPPPVAASTSSVRRRFARVSSSSESGRGEF